MDYSKSRLSRDDKKNQHVMRLIERTQKDQQRRQAKQENVLDDTPLSTPIPMKRQKVDLSSASDAVSTTHINQCSSNSFQGVFVEEKVKVECVQPQPLVPSLVTSIQTPVMATSLSTPINPCYQIGIEPLIQNTTICSTTQCSTVPTICQKCSRWISPYLRLCLCLCLRVYPRGTLCSPVCCVVPTDVLGRVRAEFDKVRPTVANMHRFKPKKIVNL